MVQFFEAHTSLQFVDGNSIPDMEGHIPEAATGGHQITVAPYSGHQVKDLLPMLRTTMRETSFWGMPIQAGSDLAAFLSATRSWRSFRHVVYRTTRHLHHLARYGRAMDLVNGVALVARLARSATDLGVQWRLSCPAVRLLQEENGAVCGAVLDTPQGEIAVHAKAVVLATGGFGHDAERRRQLFPRDPSGLENLALPVPGCTGNGLRLGESAGGHVRTDLYSPVAWAPVSEVPYADGTTGRFPHIIDRGKPGLIGVLANGQRFVNESHSYYQYVTAMIRQVPQGQEVCSWLICDHAFLRRYGLGHVRPAPVPMGSHLRSGYLKRGRNLEELARACGIDAAGLVASVAAFNRDAVNGKDPLFGRGSTPYNRKQGDSSVGRAGNPCVAPLEHAPFYAIKVKPGCFATFAGLDTDGQARVRNAQRQPIAGLYAVGTDMSSVFGGFYPSGGANIGPALTFGYVAGVHLAETLQPHDSGRL